MVHPKSLHQKMLGLVSLAGILFSCFHLWGCSGLHIPAPDVPVKPLPAAAVQESTIVLPVSLSLESMLGDLGGQNPFARKARRFLERQATKNENALLQNSYVRRQLGRTWEAVQKPIPLQNALSLVLNPQSISVSPLREEDDQLHFAIAVVARPKLVSSYDASVPPQPLPDFGMMRTSPEPGFHIVLEAEFPFDLLSAELTKQMEGKTFAGHGESVTVRAVRVYGSGDLLVIALKIKGSVSGTVYLTGSPFYDQSSQTLSLRDLDYTLETMHVLTAAADWLTHSELRESLAKKAGWQLRDRIESARQNLSSALNRSVNDYVQLVGQIDSLRPIAVGLTRNSLKAFIEADGRVELRVSN